MGRKRTHLEFSASERAMLHRCLRTAKDARARERAQFALWASTGEHTLEELARKIGRARATIQNWLDKFSAAGVAGLMERHTPPGSKSPLAGPLLQDQIRAGLESGRWHSAREIAAWLEESHGLKRARKSLYYWLVKIRRDSRGVARSCRPIRRTAVG